MIKTGATLDGFKTLSDGMLKLGFCVEDLDEESQRDLFGMRKQTGWLVFAPSPLGVVIPDEPPPEFRADKTPSQRLRACLRVLWEHSEKKLDWPDFYQNKMEKLIEWVKAKIEDTEVE
jgi:hypothetical protein